MRTIAILLGLSAVLSVTSTASAAAENLPKPVKKIRWQSAKMEPSLAKRIDTEVNKSIDAGQMSGCVVLIGRRGGIVFEKAYGNRRVEPDNEEMTTDTLFDMASLTKPVATATAAMILIERGQLR